MKKPIDPLIDYLKRSQDLGNLMNYLEIKIEQDTTNPDLMRTLSTDFKE